MMNKIYHLTKTIPKTDKALGGTASRIINAFDDDDAIKQARKHREKFPGDWMLERDGIIIWEGHREK